MQQSLGGGMPFPPWQATGDPSRPGAEPEIFSSASRRTHLGRGGRTPVVWHHHSRKRAGAWPVAWAKRPCSECVLDVWIRRGFCCR